MAEIKPANELAPGEMIVVLVDFFNGHFQIAEVLRHTPTRVYVDPLEVVFRPGIPSDPNQIEGIPEIRTEARRGANPGAKAATFFDNGIRHRYRLDRDHGRPVLCFPGTESAQIVTAFKARERHVRRADDLQNEAEREIKKADEAFFFTLNLPAPERS